MCIPRKIGKVWRKKSLRLGVLTFFKQALACAKTGCERPVFSHRASARKTHRLPARKNITPGPPIFCGLTIEGLASPLYPAAKGFLYSFLDCFVSYHGPGKMSTAFSPRRAAQNILHDISYRIFGGPPWVLPGGAAPPQDHHRLTACSMNPSRSWNSTRPPSVSTQPSNRPNT